MCDPGSREAKVRSAPLRPAEISAIYHGTVRLYGLKGEALAVNAYHHRVVGRLGEGRPLAPARRVQPLASAPAQHIRDPTDRSRALIGVVVAAEDQVHPLAYQYRLEVFAYPLVAAVLGGAVDRPVEVHDLPRLVRLPKVACEPGLLFFWVAAAVLVVQLAVERDEVGVAP